VSHRDAVTRRRLIAAAGSVAAAGIAGCSQSGTPDDSPGEGDTETTTDTETAQDGGVESRTTTSAAQPGEQPADGVIESTAEYDYVTARREEWLGREISAASVKYYQPYRESYEGFRAFLDSEGEVRPFFLKTEETFSEQSRATVSFTGTVEKFGEIDGVGVIFVENVTIER
jgi:hypothetical protein